MQLALIGCGNMGLRYVHALVQMRAAGFERIDLAAVCDTDDGRARELAAYATAHGLPAPRIVTDLGRLLADPTIEALAVVIPNHLHQTVAGAALEAGKHVLIEKPMTISTAAAAQLDRARRPGSVLAVAENFRRIPSNRAFAALLSSGALGEPKRMVMHRAASPDESYMVGRRRVDGARWYHDPCLSGSYHVFELGAHEIDLQTLWFGPVEKLHALETPIAPGLRETAISLRFASGVTSEIVFRDVPEPEETVERRLETTRGVAQSGQWSAWEVGDILLTGEPPLDLGAMTARFLGGLSTPERERMFPPGSSSLSLTARPSDPISYGVGVVLADFERAIRAGTEPEVGFDAGLRIVTICEAITASIAAEGRWITPGRHDLPTPETQA